MSYITGTDGNDLFANNGNYSDIYATYGGDDTVFAGQGDDEVYASLGET